MSFLDAFEARLRAAWREDADAGWRGARVPGRRAAVLLEPVARARVAALAAEGDARAARLALLAERAALDAAAPTAEAAQRRPSDDPAHLRALRAAADRGERERAWRARAAVGAAVLPALLAVVARRRAVADWTRLLRLWGVDDRLVGASVAALDAATAAAWRAARDARADALGVPALAPWDLYLGDERPSVDVVAAMGDAAARLGFGLGGIRVEVRDAPARAFAVDPPDDVRVRVRAGELREALHELGHALYAAHHDRALPWSLRDAPAPCVHEAVAARVAALAPASAWERLVEARLLVAMVRFERALYAEAPADPTARWWAEVDAALGIDVGAARGAPSWARVGHLLTDPAYLANYAIAERMAPRLPLGRALFAAGATLDWRPFVQD